MYKILRNLLFHLRRIKFMKHQRRAWQTEEQLLVLKLLLPHTEIAKFKEISFGMTMAHTSTNNTYSFLRLLFLMQGRPTFGFGNFFSILNLLMWRGNLDKEEVYKNRGPTEKYISLQMTTDYLHKWGPQGSTKIYQVKR